MPCHACIQIPGTTQMDQLQVHDPKHACRYRVRILLSVLSGGSFGSDSPGRSSLRIIGTTRTSRVNTKLRREFAVSPGLMLSVSQKIASSIPHAVLLGFAL